MLPRVRGWMLFLAGCIGLGVLSLAGLLRPVADLLRWTTLPVVRLSAQAAQALGRQTDGGKISAERGRQFEARLTRLAVDYVRLRTLEEENRSLRTQAHFLETSGYDNVGAQVISRQLDGGQARFIIDRGRKDRLEIGQAVVTNEGVFVGKVMVINERTAIVELLTDPEGRTAAMRIGTARLIGVIEGRGNGAAMLTYIPASEKISPEQLVVTAGTEEKVPANLPIGIINAVEGKPTDPFWNASIEPLVPLDRIAFVSILRPS